MKKIMSLYQRNYDGDRLVRDEVVPGAEWVLTGAGISTRKRDGTACMVRDGVLYRRYDRKQKNMEYKPAPEGWEACQPPGLNTLHWPGWVPVGDGPEDKWHRNSFDDQLCNGTYELVGPKIQGNPEHLEKHELIPHGELVGPVTRTFDGSGFSSLNKHW